MRKFLIANGVKTLPVDIFALSKRNGWQVIPYSKSQNFICGVDAEIVKKEWGFAALWNGKYYIFYDDNLVEEIQRFTIAHEIGHIILRHFAVKNPRVREREANMFATRVLMPMCVLYECHAKNPQEIANICQVDLTVAKTRFKRLSMLMERGKFYANKQEILVKNNFNDFIEKYNQHECNN